ncbi:copper transporter [Nocardioides acrostichi]|uniref:Copper transporter n=1 Tax=Nocardioides acrostichi TaxID=2784339 RepID=A0A930UZL1_9ACTN|nr:copper transporter [Nocardioides acrostichi]MBF4163818.1 copper transporter [Nocardioides acrostichi]
MITYRQHIVTLVAVFVALAVGLLLGGGLLAGDDTSPRAARTSSPLATGAAQGPSGDYADAFVEAAAPRIYDNRLGGSGVAIVTTPGVAADEVSALGDQVRAAGGRVTGTYDLLAPLAGGGSTPLVTSLGGQLAKEVDDGAVDSSATPYVKVGQLLGLAIATAGDQPVAPEQEASTVRDALAAADMLTASPSDGDRAPLVLVLLGDSAGTDADAAVEGLITGLGATASGLVVAGSSQSASDDGPLARVRASSVGDTVASVDGVERPLGAVSAVLALARSRAGTVGSYGPVAKDSGVPLG